MLIRKENLPLVAMDFMNDVHFEDVVIINELYDLILNYEETPNMYNKNLINMKFMLWYEHTIKHFDGEEVEMLEKGFPPYPIHKNEHEICLKRMNDIFNEWKESADLSILKNYLSNEMPTWLMNHIKTMDMVTAMFLKTGVSPCSAH